MYYRYTLNILQIYFKTILKYTTDISKYINGSFDSLSNAHVEKITSEKLYPDSMLEKLLPHYSFYEKKGIFTTTIKTGYE